MPAVPLRTQRRAGRNRTAILAAAEKLFGARGVEAVSIDEVAAAADLAKGTVYNHFTDKDGLAREIAAAVREDGEARVATANEGVADPVRRTVRGVLVFARFAAERPARVRAVLRFLDRATDVDAPINAGLRSDIAAGVTAGAFADVTVETGTLMVLGQAQILMARILEAELGHDAAKALGAEIATLILRALGCADAAHIARDEANDIFKGETT